MKLSCHRPIREETAVHARLASTFREAAIAIGLLGALAQASCMPLRSEAPAPATRTAATAANTESGTSAMGDVFVEGADTAYYFDSASKLVAVAGLDGLPFKIKPAEMVSNSDGMRLVMLSIAQNGLPKFEGRTEMVGKASTVVYAVSGASLLAVLGVEDLTGVTSRVIEPMTPLPLEEGSTCCCKAVRCDGAICCPCGTSC